MKKLALAAAFGLFATSAVAGSCCTDPIVEPIILLEQSEASSLDHDLLPPLMFLLLVAGALAAPAALTM